jgi:hypothetical protein
MPDLFTFWLVVLAVLIVYLCVSLWVHSYLEEVKLRHREREFQGNAFRVSAIAPQIQQVRQNHIAAARARPSESFYRMALMAAASQVVTSLAYFRRDRSDDEKPSAC